MGDAAQRPAQGRVILRRLNRVEYENTVRDLLGITVDLKEQLPQDGSADGFDNAGAAHHTSSFLMEGVPMPDRMTSISLLKGAFLVFVDHLNLMSGKWSR